MSPLLLSYIIIYTFAFGMLFYGYGTKAKDPGNPDCEVAVKVGWSILLFDLLMRLIVF